MQEAPRKNPRCKGLTPKHPGRCRHQRGSGRHTRPIEHLKEFTVETPSLPVPGLRRPRRDRRRSRCSMSPSRGHRLKFPVDTASGCIWAMVRGAPGLESTCLEALGPGLPGEPELLPAEGQRFPGPRWGQCERPLCPRAPHARPRGGDLPLLDAHRPHTLTAHLQCIPEAWRRPMRRI